MHIPTMSTDTSGELALTRLLQLISPSLPIGGYTYSQGIEWAVESGWIVSADDLGQWLDGILQTNLRYIELPILQRMLEAWKTQDLDCLEHWNETLVASRETAELRLEESQRARAFCELLQSLHPSARQYRSVLRQSQLACYSFACSSWNIGYRQAACGLLSSWLENLVLSAIKIIPLGQTAGQQVIFDLGSTIPGAIDAARQIDDDDIGASSMAMAIASARHETQYTRLFRS